MSSSASEPGREVRASQGSDLQTRIQDQQVRSMAAALSHPIVRVGMVLYALMSGALAIDEFFGQWQQGVTFGAVSEVIRELFLPGLLLFLAWTMSPRRIRGPGK